MAPHVALRDIIHFLNIYVLKNKKFKNVFVTINSYKVYRPRLPLNITIVQKILNYILYIKSKN